MTSLQFILASLRHYRRVHLAVALGVCVATAVLTGALLVGDSVRGSLRDLTLERLGRIDHALVTGQPFRAELADELSATAGFDENFSAAHPALLVSGTLEGGAASETTRATRVSIVGYDPGFAQLGDGFPMIQAGEPPVLITQPLAEELGIVAGDEIVVRVSAFEAIPTDSPLGEKIDAGRSRRMTVAAVLPATGLARFSLQPSQHLPRNAFVPLARLQDLLEQPGEANAILVAAQSTERATDEAATAALADMLHPQLEDFGLNFVRREPAGGNAYLELTSASLVVPNAVVSAVEKAFPDVAFQPVVSYLANTIRIGENTVPYSTITGIDSTARLGPIFDDAGEPIVLADDEIVLNRWAADNLGAAVGDEVRVAFYEPESTHGKLEEHEPVVFRLRAIVELADAEGNPTIAADRYLTPELEGVTDKQSINDWELPFELTEPIDQADEDYWDEYAATPKAFVTFATAERFWTSRWGTVSLLRTPATDATDVEQFRTQLAAAIDPADVGFTFLPVKRQGLEASSGTTPFDGLFLGFSMFLIASSLMLIVLLFQLGVQQRAGEIGVLAATGAGRRGIARLLSREALCVAALGAVVGVACGVGYAWLMIFGLNTVWQDAIATPFLRLHAPPRSLLVGWLLSVVVTWLAIRLSLRHLVRIPARQLLAGDTSDHATRGKNFGYLRLFEIVMWLAAVLLIVAGRQLEGEAQAGTFFGCGAAVLAASLARVRRMLPSGRTSSSGTRRLTLDRLAAGNAARNSGRSTLTIGLVAAACFLIIAISAFRIGTSDSGTGGFAIIATSDQPLHYDLNSADGRWELGITDTESEQLGGWQFESLRVHDGEEASCLSLYRPTQPRVLGVRNWSLAKAPFAFAATSATDDGDPWQQLDIDLGNDDAGRQIVPVVLDMNTAMYSLQKYTGVGTQMTIRDGNDTPVTLQFVGLLKNSMLQGDLLVSEANFLRLFPEAGGYRMFLARPTDGTPTDLANVELVSRLLESSALGDYGFDAMDAKKRLADFLAVQNTYLSTFQSLGALGLLLGTFGLAVVQLRSVLQRRGELALMRAEGFGHRRLIRLVLAENVVLLGGGLVIGGIAAAVALLPNWAPEQTSVPWATLLALLVIIAAVGTAAAWLSTRRALAAPILPALRGD